MRGKPLAKRSSTPRQIHRHRFLEASVPGADRRQTARMRRVLIPLLCCLGATVDAQNATSPLKRYVGTLDVSSKFYMQPGHLQAPEVGGVADTPDSLPRIRP